MVNFKYSRTFNGVFEKQNLTKNEKVFAKIHANCTWTSPVYHDRINYDLRLREIYGFLKQRLRHQSAALNGSSAYHASRRCGIVQLFGATGSDKPVVTRFRPPYRRSHLLGARAERGVIKDGLFGGA